MNIMYAQLGNNGIIVGISQLSGEVIQDNMIEISEYDTELLGKKYVNGEFIDVVEE